MCSSLLKLLGVSLLLFACHALEVKAEDVERYERIRSRMEAFVGGSDETRRKLDDGCAECVAARRRRMEVKKFHIDNYFCLEQCGHAMDAGFWDQPAPSLNSQYSIDCPKRALADNDYERQRALEECICRAYSNARRRTAPGCDPCAPDVRVRRLTSQEHVKHIHRMLSICQQCPPTPYRRRQLVPYNPIECCKEETFKGTGNYSKAKQCPECNDIAYCDCHALYIFQEARRQLKPSCDEGGRRSLDTCYQACEEDGWFGNSFLVQAVFTVLLAIVIIYYLGSSGWI